MDAFLRRVVEQREREQEEAILARPLEEFANQHCRVCGKRCSRGSDLRDPLTVCTGCGGRKRQRQLEREDFEFDRARRRAERLLQLAGIHPQPEGAMPDTDVRLCSTPDCGRKLRSDNTSGLCSSCRQTIRPRERPAAKGASVRKQFRVLTDTLGFDGDDLVERFMSGWIDRVRNSVRVEDDE